MSDTHVNAFKIELQEAELEASRVNGRVESLKRTIKAMEAEETPVEEPASEPVQVEEPAEVPIEETPVEEEKVD